MSQPQTHRPRDEHSAPWRRRLAAFRRSPAASTGLGWRLLTPAVLVLAGALFVTSAVNSAGTDLRPGRYADLADLAASRSDRIAELEREHAQLLADVERLTEGLSSTTLDELQAELDQLRGPAGLEPVAGPGVTITLDDAPDSDLDDDQGDDQGDDSLEVVHQQDLQAVVNALWAGGAEALTVQGRRITSSTGIKCVGNSVLLQGVAYPPPYQISAIGDGSRMLLRIDSDPQIQRYLRDAATYGLGWDVELEDRLEFPRYDGPTDTDWARPLQPEAGSS